ncbi:hypothetical protein Q3G72_031165 [Acer saccharum]|nr:hypothetical protein Q3G72_031165 [Acer saccharum]
MSEIWRSRSLCSLLLFCSISLQFLSAFSDDSSSGKGKQTEAHATSKSSSNTGAKASGTDKVVRKTKFLVIEA